MIKTPIAIFTYNRPVHTRNMLASLAACTLLEECAIYIFSDAPRIPEHAQKVDEVRALVRAWGVEHGAQVIERGENFGLARSIVEGVTELCEQYGRIIVVEDDLILHPAFLHYMLSALGRYENEERVAQVAGYMHPVAHDPSPDAFFLPFTSSWGWATWNRSWKLFEWNIKGSEALSNDLAMRHRFDLNGSYPFAEMLEERLKGRNQSWAILFYWAVFQSGKLVLHPAQPLVKNMGFDGSGIHYTRKHPRLTRLMKTSVLSNWDKDHPFIFPNEVTTDEQAFMRVKEYLYHSTYQNTSWIGRVKRKIKFLLSIQDG